MVRGKVLWPNVERLSVAYIEILNVVDHNDTATVNKALDANRQGMQGEGLPPGKEAKRT